MVYPSKVIYYIASKFFQLLNMRKSILFFLLIVILFSCHQPASPVENAVHSNASLQEDLLRGWNTWNNPNLLSHVLMPEGLSLRLTFRKRKGGPYWLDQAYITGPHVNFPEKVTPIAHAYDGSYTELEIDWAGMKSRVQSAHYGKNDLVLLYTPISLPKDPHWLVLETSFLWNKPGTVDRQNGILTAHAGSETIPVGATGKLSDLKFPLDAPYYVLRSDTVQGFFTGNKIPLDSIVQIINNAKNRFTHTSDNYGDLSEAYRAMQSVISWNVIYDAQNNRAIAPVSRVWNEAWGGYIIFDWDTYFTAVMLSLDDKELAYSNAIAITNAITRGGFIPNVEASFGVKSNDRSQPPVGSLCCKMIYNKYHEKWFLVEVYDNLLTWNRWWDKARNNRGYLSWGSDDVPDGMDGHTRQAAKWESGLDNSPLFDQAVFNVDNNMLDLASVGLMSLYIMDCNQLADIAGILDKKDDQAELMQRSAKYGLKLQELWDDKTGIFRDKYLTTGQFSNHLAPTNFYALLSGVPTPEQARRMIDEHFMDPKEFYGKYMIPSIARDDPGYRDNSYWRGRIWAPMNFLVYMGLRNYDLPEARKILVDKSLELLMQEWKQNRRVYENYNSETGVGGDVYNANDFYAWGGLLGFIALMDNGYYLNNNEPNGSSK